MEAIRGPGRRACGPPPPRVNCENRRMPPFPEVRSHQLPTRKAARLALAHGLAALPADSSDAFSRPTDEHAVAARPVAS